MAVVPMQKVQVIVHNDHRDEALALMQKSGVVEIAQVKDNTHDEYLVVDKTSEKETLDYKLSRVTYAIDYLKEFEEPRKGLEAIVEGESVRVSDVEKEEIVKNFCFEDTIHILENTDAEIVRLQNTKRELEEQRTVLLPWKELTFSLDEAWETDYTQMVIGEIDERDFEIFKEDIGSHVAGSHVEVVSRANGTCSVLVVFLQEAKESINTIFKDYRFQVSPLMSKSGVPSVEIKNLESKIADAEAGIQKQQEQLMSLVKDLPKLKVIFDELSNNHEVLMAEQKFMSSDFVSFFYGWIPQESFNDFVDAAQLQIQNIEIAKIDSDSVAEVPVAIKNNSFLRPFEAVTNIYGMPLSNEVDPTPYLAVFFITFFGFCLTDAGYGVLLVIFMTLYIKICKVPTPDQKLWKLIAYGGVVTTVLGVLFGGWFGISPDAAWIPEYLTYDATVNGVEQKLFIGQLINPVKSPMLVLAIALVLGYIQVAFGKLVDVYSKMRQKAPKHEAFASFMWVVVLCLGVVLGAVSFMEMSETVIKSTFYVFYASLGTLILAQGWGVGNIIAKPFVGVLMFLQDLIGVFADVMSYSRLLALGLATGIIASSVNSIASILGEMIPVVGGVVTVLILIVGHIVNVGLNALGSFIHSGRLQFIEFFGKFLEGGGREFNPLRVVNRYVRKPQN